MAPAVGHGAVAKILQMCKFVFCGQNRIILLRQGREGTPLRDLGFVEMSLELDLEELVSSLQIKADRSRRAFQIELSSFYS